MVTTIAASTTAPKVNPYLQTVAVRPEKVSHVVVEWNLSSEVKCVNLVPLFTTLLNRAAATGKLTFLDTNGDEFGDSEALH